MVTSAFTRLANVRRNHLGMPGHPTVVVEHPLASMKPDRVAALANSALNEVAQALTVVGLRDGA